MFEFLNDITSSIFRISMLFLIFTAVFHFVLIYKYPLSLKNWKLVEYIWVLLAFISTLGIVDQSRRANAMAQLTQTEIQLERDKQQVIDWFDNYQQLTCIEDIDEQQCVAFKRANYDLELMLTDNEVVPAIDQHLIKRINHLTALNNQGVIKHITARITQYTAAKLRYQTTQQRTMQSALQHLLNLLTPLLLAFALALKMTKVTAEHLALKRKEQH